MGQYPERIAARMRVTWESRQAEETLKAKWSKRKKLWNTSNSNLRLWNSCPAAKLQSRIDSFFYLFLRFLLCPLATPPLFIAISFHVFFSFQAVLHVPDMSRCSHTPRSFKFTPRLIFPPIRATCTATPSTTPTKTMDAPPFKIRQFIFAIKRQFQAICSDLPNGTQRVKHVIL